MRTSTLLRDLSADTSSALAGVAAITKSYRTTADTGHYEYLYLSYPQLKHALQISREVLLVVAPYTDLQFRTLQLARREIENSNGRVEPRVILVIHKDPAGDHKLKMWGHEEGLTVLPVYAQGTLPVRDKFTQLILKHLYTTDPFDYTGPINEASQFFGRPDLAELSHRLSRGTIHSLFGVRKAGKTSALKRILDDARLHHGCACVAVDCQLDAISGLSAGQLMNSIGGAVIQAHSPAGSGYSDTIPLSADSEVTASEAATTLLSVLRPAKKPTVIVIDEIDYITPGSPTASHWGNEFVELFRSLRWVYQECSRAGIPLSLVVCGVSSHWFSVPAVNGVENSALSLVPNNYLAGLGRSDSIEMIQQLGRSCGLIFPDESANAIADYCSDFPFFVRRACSYIFSCYPVDSRPARVELEHVSELLPEYLAVEGREAAAASCVHLLSVYPTLIPVADSISRDGPRLKGMEHLESAIGRYGLMGKGWAFAGPLVEAGMAVALDSATNSATTVDGGELPLPGRGEEVVAGGAGEHAVILGEIGELVNACELKLRDVVKTVLRKDAREKTDQRSATDRVLKALDERRRRDLADEGLGSILKALYLAELLNVVRREWRVFEQVFGDKSRFNQHADIIEDRQHAHAKDADLADLANQRRSCRWIVDRIDSYE